MLQINKQDVANVVSLCIPYLVAFAVILVIGILVMNSLLTFTSGEGQISEESLHESEKSIETSRAFICKPTKKREF